MSASDRQELVRNAVAFLVDPKTQASPLAQRIQFLEAKGLTPQEIDYAFKQTSVGSVTPQLQAQYGHSYGPVPYHLASAPPSRWDWRDYFITAVLSGSVAYGAMALYKKYLLPHLQPPDTTAYEQDRDALNAQFDAAELLLKEIQAESAAVRAAVEEQKDVIEKTTKDVQAVVAEMREGEFKTRDEMREMRDEINNIREMLPKMIEKNKESHNQSLAELQQELKSLKALLLNRGPSTSSTPSSPPVLGRPSIPAWQLTSGTPNIENSNAASSSPTSNPMLFGSGKAKEVEST
ncbi:hypothetical protein AX17_000687 [Amanita inopinata Kibby_2008]|nr:hypothetical protein AX17_000687 [Amanita inopinata Kibby_2008]